MGVGITKKRVVHYLKAGSVTLARLTAGWTAVGRERVGQALLGDR
jgi:hypothetical protein